MLCDNNKCLPHGSVYIVPYKRVKTKTPLTEQQGFCHLNFDTYYDILI